MLIDPKRCVLLLSLLTLGNCAWFGGDDAETVEPRELERVNAEIDIEKRWDHNIGGGAESGAVNIVPGLAGNRVFIASPDGNVLALDADSGKVRWKIQVQGLYSTKERKAMFPDDMDVITGGVGVGGDLAVVAVVGGELIALNQSDGSVAWRAKTSSEVLASPAVDEELVFVQSVDGKVLAYDALDGARQWSYSTSVPRLTVRGTSTPVLFETIVIVGFANGRVVGLDRRQGLPVMDERIAISQGKSDLERLVDVDGRMVIRGGRLFAVSYQGNAVAIDLNETRASWKRPASSLVGLGEGFGNIYLTAHDSHVTALDMDDGDEVWDTDALLHRDVTAPITISSYIVVGDFEGYLHFIAQSDGRFVGRVKAGGKGIISPPVVDGRRVYVMDKGSRLYAYEIR
ncbi:MAG: outer membrane protein assembly factor BamB [Pseudomonadales bacterium]